MEDVDCDFIDFTYVQVASDEIVQDIKKVRHLIFYMQIDIGWNLKDSCFGFSGHTFLYILYNTL